MALHHAASGEVVHLPLVSAGAAQTKAMVKSPAFEAIHLVLAAGETIAAHQVEGAMTLYCIEGTVAVDLGEDGVQMQARDWLHLDPQVSHALHALSDSAMLLTILFDHSVQGRARQGSHDA